jgi:hypothetical protein
MLQAGRCSFHEADQLHQNLASSLGTEGVHVLLALSLEIASSISVDLPCCQAAMHVMQWTKKKLPFYLATTMPQSGDAYAS